ncbi:MAG: glycosyltransferase family 4 protein, partial [Crocinitomicaceae bacterium]|nr:glycosyltransferase family 4 protein [Crocinitomicaceae bacterium]
HRLKHKRYKTEAYYNRTELYNKLREIEPDIVQTFAVESIIMWQTVNIKKKLGFKLFSANHVLRSVFPLADQWESINPIKRLAWNLKHKRSGRVLSKHVELYFYQTLDAEEIAVTYFGADPTKSKIDPLGVDTDHFKPQEMVNDALRTKFGFTENDWVCIYTGRLSKGKSPLVLAKAIDLLAKDHPEIKGLFIGNGEQEEEIKKLRNCITHPFVKFPELPDYYNLAKIGVWPKEESTSMLDAMACGLPLIISNTVTATERVEGNGLTYIENDHTDLAKQIVKLKNSGTQFKEMSRIGIQKIMDKYSWEAIARQREKDYLKALDNEV